MKRKYPVNLPGILLIALLISAFAGCSKSDRIPNDPADTVTLNMLNELHGKTLLGKTDVYINKSNNFTMSSNFISDAGEMGGLGVEIHPQLNNLSQEAAVIPGHVYQIFHRNILLEFPSGKRALQQGAPYLQSYVISPIENVNTTTGAIIKFFQTSSYEEALPEFNHRLGIFHNRGDRFEISLPSGSEWVLGDRNYEEVEEVLSLSKENGKLYITLNQTPSEVSGPYGSYYLFIRLNGIYTAVRMGVLVY